VESIHCASDPESLDAIILPEYGKAWVDGTAPHTVDARLPGARDDYINLGTYYNHEALLPKTEQIAKLFAEYAIKRRAVTLAVRALGSAYALFREDPTEELKSRLQRRAKGITARLLPQEKTSHGTFQRRILSAIGENGIITHYGTIFENCSRVCELIDGNGAADTLLEGIQEAALSRGATVIACMNPILPDVRAQLILPEAKTAFVTSDMLFRIPRPPQGTAFRRIRLDGERTPERQKQKKLLQELTEKVGECVREAKRIHDELEAVYHPFVDFNGVEKLAQTIAETL